MKSIALILMPLLFLSSCTIDWNGEKDKRIAELEKQVTELKEKNDGALFKKKIECQEKYEKTWWPWNRDGYLKLDIEVFFSESKNSCLFRLSWWRNNERLFAIADILWQTTLASFSVDENWGVVSRYNMEGDLNKLKCDFNYNLRLLWWESYFDAECNPTINLK